MLRTLAFIGIAAVAARQLKKSGALDRFAESAKERADQLKRHIEDRRDKFRASHEAAGGPGGGPILAPAGVSGFGSNAKIPNPPLTN